MVEIQRRKILAESMKKGEYSEVSAAQAVQADIILAETARRREEEKKRENKTYGEALIILKNAEGERKIKVIIKERSEPDSFLTETYILSHESLLACTISKTSIGSEAKYKNGNGGVENSVTVIEKTDF